MASGAALASPARFQEDVAVGAGCGIYILVPPVAVSLRSSIRSRYGIKGSICDDIAISCFCLTCSWCQMHREIKDLNKNRVAIINTQPLPVMMKVQPPMMRHTPCDDGTTPNGCDPTWGHRDVIMRFAASPY
ncbi:unnamed protein product [Pleuronectes platessa]|uniref:Uncharacterized protein n=1 Tax=Pleuronectes platessa TaxID=8262 RepID=A0A9N7YMP0_PLEPL|nr:unnamed protein product [Pleuronectes platessa]